jgi:hypothetical protein
MAIKGLDGLSVGQVLAEVERGAKFVTFPYCIWVIVISFRRTSDVHFIRPGESVIGKSFPYILISLFLGWWGVPWGLIWTPTYIIQNLAGGKNVTDQILPSLRPQASPPAPAAAVSQPQWPPTPTTGT